MKQILILIFLSFIWLPALGAGGNSDYVSIEEYSRFFVIGLDDETEEEIEEDFKPRLKEKMELSGGEIINLDSSPVKLKIEKTGFFDSYKQAEDIPQSKVDLIKTEKFNFFSDAKKELSDYMTNNLKSTLNASYEFNDSFSLRAGHEVWYVNPNASVGAKKFYLNPRLNLTERCYLDYTGKYNQTTKNIEQEVGLNYSPKLFKNAASFGVKASSVTNRDNEVQSKKLKFTTDIYIF